MEGDDSVDRIGRNMENSQFLNLLSKQVYQKVHYTDVCETAILVKNNEHDNYIMATALYAQI